MSCPDDESSLTRRAMFGALLAAGFVADRQPAFAEDTIGVSDWSTSDHAKVRLIDAGPAPQDLGGNAQRLAGIEIQLDSMYLTYWRSPGEAGVPPDVGFAGSINVADATALYPAPRRFSEGGTEAIGYKGNVVFPLLVSMAEPAKPVTLALSFGFAICERLCIPVHAKASLLLDGDGQTPEAGLVRDALALIPTKRSLGQAGPLTVTAVLGTAGQDTINVLAKTSGNDVPLLFAEAPEPWFVQAGEGLWINDGAIKFPIKVLSKPVDPAPLPLRLTLVGVEGAIEVSVSLDAPPPKP